mmetsp:Transcript_10223/g.31897  ORF Transcript_10223/g.31897 Transcript_10223/m.31897 type:complete len:245 (+) Transcript_10223:74-808(+)
MQKQTRTTATENIISIEPMLATPSFCQTFGADGRLGSTCTVCCAVGVASSDEERESRRGGGSGALRVVDLTQAFHVERHTLFQRQLHHLVQLGLIRHPTPCRENNLFDWKAQGADARVHGELLVEAVGSHFHVNKGGLQLHKLPTGLVHTLRVDARLRRVHRRVDFLDGETDEAVPHAEVHLQDIPVQGPIHRLARSQCLSGVFVPVLVPQALHECGVERADYCLRSKARHVRATSINELGAKQ